MIQCDSEAMVQTSFLNNLWPNLQRKWPCITFTCTLCREDMKTKQDVLMSGRVRLLEENSLHTRKRLEEIADMISGLADKKLPEENQRPTYRDMAVRDAPSVIVVDKAVVELSKEENQARMNEVTKAAIQSKAGVKSSFTNKEGKTVFVCKNDKAKEALLPHVKKVFDTRKITTPISRLPTISVPFIAEKYEKDDLMTALHNQNEDSGILFEEANTKIIFIAPMKEKPGHVRERVLYQAVLRVSDAIRARINSNGNRLFIGANSCPVYDRFFIKRCYRCQDLHHIQTDCQKAEVCAFCAENHDTSKCEKDPNHPKCANCEKSENTNTGHPAFSIDCPCYTAEQAKLKKTIHYYSKNP